jgi:hypothetical protein
VALLDQNNLSTHPTENVASTSFVPYYTARVSLSQFTYTFRVNKTGPKFVRLHFNPASYTGFCKQLWVQKNLIDYIQYHHMYIYIVYRGKLLHEIRR